MKLEDQVCTEEQGIKFQNFGLNRGSLFFYYMGEIIGGSKSMQSPLEVYTPAYTASELMEMLPFSMRLTEMIDYNLILVKTGNGYASCYERVKKDGGTEKFENKVFYSQTPAKSLSDLLTWLLENNHISPEYL
jgi:hypothetical protein